MFFRINLELEKIKSYGMTIVFESKPTNNYLVNIEKVFQQSKESWISFQLKKRYSFTRNSIVYGYNLFWKKLRNNGIQKLRVEEKYITKRSEMGDDPRL